jgi:hypothetical protein
MRNKEANGSGNLVIGILVTLFFVFIVLSAHAQGLDDYLDLSGTESGDQEDPLSPAAAGNDDRGPIDTFMDWMQTHHLIATNGLLSNWWSGITSRWEEYRRIMALKASIESMFGVTLREGGVWSIPGSREYKTTCWTIAELEAVKYTFEHVPESFRKFTRYINRAEAHIEDGVLVPATNGGVWPAASDTVFLFNAASAGGGGNGYADFKRTLVHEMTHAYQKQDASILDSWNSEFWKEHDGGGIARVWVQKAPDLRIRGQTQANLRRGAFPLGSPLTFYAAYAGQLGEHRGDEDQAEAVASAWCSPGSLGNFPKRKEFLFSRFPAELFDEAHAAAGGAAGTTGAVGSWDTLERFSYTYNPVLGYFDLTVPGYGGSLGVGRVQRMSQEVGLGDLDEEDIE